MYQKDSLDFMNKLKECAILDEKTGTITFKGMYACSHLNMQFGNKGIATPYSHVVWFLKYGCWPKKGYHIDHINDDPMDNRPENLQEITHIENQKKRRGRIVSPAYGKGKYGYGMYIHYDKRDGRYYVTRNISRGFGEGDLKGIKASLGGYDNLDEAEIAVKKYIKIIKFRGLDYIPQAPKAEKKTTKTLNEMTETFREMRKQGMTIQEIKNATGFKSGIYDRIKDIEVDGRNRLKGEGNTSARLTEAKVKEIRKLNEDGSSISEIALRFQVSDTMIKRIIKRKAWKHLLA